MLFEPDFHPFSLHGIIVLWLAMERENQCELCLWAMQRLTIGRLCDYEERDSRQINKQTDRGRERKIKDGNR